jgi:ubiquitin-like domain-containing CTD phosphatase 1
MFTDLEFLPDIVNDLDIDFSADPAAAAAYMNDMRNQRKIREVTRKLNLNIINPLRSDKPLLVLDIDYSERMLHRLFSSNSVCMSYQQSLIQSH